MACEPDVMILDEPTTGLDYRECMEIMDRIAARNRAGATVLMVCHDMEVVQDFARRVLVVAGGRLIGDGPAEEIMADEALLARASVAPAQIPQLALRLGDAFRGVSTIDQMVSAIEGRVRYWAGFSITCRVLPCCTG
jgi:energy-coupling factor transport system ATP-binding protein